ncbi:MAG: LPXTG cell wall anchor domain-containing protein, partial [Promethearchaeota archaeon]
DEKNIAVFDWFHFLANPLDFAAKDDYVDDSDSHPNLQACEDTTTVFIGWIDDVIARWQTGNGSTTLPTTSETPTIPGFPFVAIASGVALALGVIFVKRRKNPLFKK